MKTIEKAKTQKIVDKIQAGNFDENDIDNLFMKLRSSSNGNNVFREIADFVAHNDQRDRGLTNESLEAMYFSFKYFLEYVSPKKPLDLTHPFPMWIKSLIKYQINKVDEKVLKEKFHVGRERLKVRVEKGFKDDKKSKTTQLKNRKLSKETLEAIKYVMSFIISKEAFSQNDLIKQINNVISQNKLIFDENKIHEQSNRITLCVLLLLHNSEFDYKGHKLGYCRIASDKESILYNSRFVDKDGNAINIDESFGKLKVHGHVVMDKDGNDLTIAYPIMSTELDVEEWCEETLFHIEPLSKEISNHLYKRLKLEHDLSISDDFRLVGVST